MESTFQSILQQIKNWNQQIQIATIGVKLHSGTIEHGTWSLGIHVSSLCGMISRFVISAATLPQMNRSTEYIQGLAFEVALARLHEISLGVCREHRVRVYDIDRRVAKRTKRRPSQPFVDAGLVKLKNAWETRIGSSMYKESQGNDKGLKRIF